MTEPCGTICEIYAKAKESISVEKDASPSNPEHELSAILNSIGYPSISSVISQYEKRLDVR